MTNKIKTAFDCITAETELKRSVLRHIYGQRNKKRVLPVKRILAVLSSVVIVAISSVYTAFFVYYSESVYINLEVNPSIEFIVNRFNRIIGAYAYNSDGELILSEINITHKDYRDALETAIDVMEKRGFNLKEAVVSITTQKDDGKKENEMLTGIESTIRLHHGGTVEITACSIDNATRRTARGYNLSPSKYLAILNLQEVDPSATIENCREHSLSEIYKRTQEHSSGHHNGENNGNAGGGNRHGHGH